MRKRIRSSFPKAKLLVTESKYAFRISISLTEIISLQDASWILPASSPLKCTSPSDVYLLLKSSDFISHDISEEHVFDGCETETESQHSEMPPYELELVLRKWYAVDRSRELRCFVRQNVLLGIYISPFPRKKN